MSLQTNLLGLYRYLLGTQQRREEDRLRGTLPGRLSSPLLSQGAPKCHQEDGCLPADAKESPYALLLASACPKSTLCLEVFFNSDQKPLEVTIPECLMEMEDTVLDASGG